MCVSLYTYMCFCMSKNEYKNLFYWEIFISREREKEKEFVYVFIKWCGRGCLFVCVCIWVIKFVCLRVYVGMYVCVWGGAYVYVTLCVNMCIKMCV